MATAYESSDMDGLEAQLERIVGDLPDPAWSTHAACGQIDHNGNTIHDPDLWFPHRNETRARLDEARSICWSCPVREQCLQFAIDTSQTHGIWGGMTYRQRLKERYRLRDVA